MRNLKKNQMTGFDWNTFYSLFQAKMKDVCTVGRYTTPKLTTFPYCDVELSDISGGNYDLVGNEGIQKVMITLNVYCNNYDDATCYDVSMKAKEVMLSYGFECTVGPIKIDNMDPAVARWVARYKRTFGNGDVLKQLH